MFQSAIIFIQFDLKYSYIILKYSFFNLVMNNFFNKVLILNDLWNSIHHFKWNY